MDSTDFQAELVKLTKIPPPKAKAPIDYQKDLVKESPKKRGRDDDECPKRATGRRSNDSARSMGDAPLNVRLNDKVGRSSADCTQDQISKIDTPIKPDAPSKGVIIDLTQQEDPVEHNSTRLPFYGGGDWFCEYCKCQVFRTRLSCEKCGRARIDEPETEPADATSLVENLQKQLEAKDHEAQNAHNEVRKAQHEAEQAKQQLKEQKSSRFILDASDYGDPEVNEAYYGVSKFGGVSRSNYEHQRNTCYKNLIIQARGCDHYDPSRSKTAFAEAVSQGLATLVFVKHVQVSHDQVSSTFRHGVHAGTSLGETLDRLKSGADCTLNFTPVVLIRDAGQLWVVFGNRRVTVAKKLQAYFDDNGVWGWPVCLKAIEYDINKAPPQIFAKYMLARTGNGKTPELGRRRRR